ncbi:ParB/Srx family N-terminal domain-containing protein [Bradyrhizobium japonicum]|uniref:ParB/Srx family N-terminal domain-containing protein n=1 Tax=Bradyrhizobium japonicum TaxID=375 RepID=UPI0009B8619C|nr:ParB/Srx family N-terminal domain-containing protein [Bradyrhizobium japonicum]
MITSVAQAAPSQLSIVYRPANNLVPDPRNARTHPKRQIEQLKASIKEFGFTNPILVDPDGNIIAGHGRRQAPKALGLAQAPTITLSDLSETQKRALRLSDFRTTSSLLIAAFTSPERPLIRRPCTSPVGKRSESLTRAAVYRCSKGWTRAVPAAGPSTGMERLSYSVVAAACIP